MTQIPSSPWRLAALLAATAFFFSTEVRADIVELTDGTVLEGKILRETDDFVTIFTTDRKRKVLARRKIRRAVRGMGFLDVYREKSRALARSDAEGHVGLSAWCERHGRPGLATLHYRRAISADPDNKTARHKIGHVLWEGRWYPTHGAMMAARGRKPFRGRWLEDEAFAEATKGHAEHGGDWFTPEEKARLDRGGVVELPKMEKWSILRTLHYRLRVRLRPTKGLAFANIAEQAFSSFQKFFGFEPEGVLEGDIFASLKEFREFVVGLGLAAPDRLYSHGFFDSSSRKIYFPYIDDNYTSINILLHELCHQFEILARPQSSITPWFFEGIACVFGHHLWKDGKLHTPRISVRKNFNMYYFQHRVRTGGARSLMAVLKGSPGARVDPVFYNHAWGLAWFLLSCKEGGYAERFPAYRDYIHSPKARGRDPIEVFCEHFGELAVVEKDFLAYILSIKGMRWRGKGKPVGGK
jgi:hypothetical protein